MINLISAAEAVTILFTFRRLSVLNEKQKNLVLNIISAFLLCFNIFRYAIQSFKAGEMRIPVDFSAVSYFLVPAIVLMRLGALRVWAAYSGVLAGSGYFLCMTVFGDMAYAGYKPSSVASALLCHGALLICGLLIISEKEFSPFTGWIITIGLIGISLNAFLLRDHFAGGNGIFIYELLFAFRPIAFFGGGIIPFYYVLLFALVILSFNMFYRLNVRLAKQKFRTF